MDKNIPTMQSRITNDVLRKAEPIADTQQHIIIIGEYGSGKSWLAKKIHNASNRSNNPFININCYTLGTNEAQKKIFGYLQFTEESVRINKGLFEKSNGGTLCLEGFDTLSERLQKKILHSVESHNAHHVGSSSKIPIDVRTIISIDVKSYFNSQQKFDLLTNSLNIEPFTINYPPLRERREEIYEMVQNFLKSELSQKYDFAANKISARAMYLCIRYDWPGNVQQLKNAIEHAAIVSGGDIIQPEHLPNSVKQGQPKSKELEYLEKTYTYRIAERNLIKNALLTCTSSQQLKNKLGLSTEDFKKKLNDYQLEPELT
jgi:DNA-binding NtrC family response regulator